MSDWNAEQGRGERVQRTWEADRERLRRLVAAVRAHVGPTPACLAFPANTAGLTCRTVHPIHAEVPCALCTLVTELEACEVDQ
jgi:hypothetical protein